ncbi:efflux RND transporter periplasmic adaptor subunit [Rheinheimera sp. MMS21-TC3]|uniref:efflux RND transporter periplasmic adaptor subunit n=1 Tax=Rheinheimera sp. MMS21-TC3 TaxID=3072790 RepID=UPI0028C4087B|nr:efflux RND transporter periplasmic adaptor subunit [Rheinheimera sp. MMS21-TC3]WNO59736.1 efflux RND transporter periplasmic adaptor subunit [Rheinheimera sp. MMS21-TC3]
MKKLWVAVLIVLVMASVISFSQYRKQHQQLDVNIAEVTQGSLSDTILASGNLEYHTQIQIRTEVTGRVIEVLVEEGDMVEKGQVLMRLDPTAFAADVERVRELVKTQEIDIQRSTALLADGQRQLKRQLQLADAGLVQQEMVDSLQSQVDIAKINVAAAQSALRQSQASLAMVEDILRKTIFRAPIAGLLAGVDVKPGETVIAGTTNIIGSPLMMLADPSTILAELRVDEADIANVYVGQQVKVFAAAYPRKEIQGEVIQIATSARAMTQNQSLSFRVKVLLQPEDLALFSGMSCRAELVLNQQADSIQIPIAAVQRQGNSVFVWLVKDNKAVKQEVELGLATDTAQQVLSGLSLQQSVIIGPARTLTHLTEGTLVNTTLLTTQEQ